MSKVPSVRWRTVRRNKEQKVVGLAESALTVRFGQIRTARSRSPLPITDTELKLMAAAAITGLKSNPKAGYCTPAAMG